MVVANDMRWENGKARQKQQTVGETAPALLRGAMRASNGRTGPTCANTRGEAESSTREDKLASVACMHWRRESGKGIEARVQWVGGIPRSSVGYFGQFTGLLVDAAALRPVGVEVELGTRREPFA